LTVGSLIYIIGSAVCALATRIDVLVAGRLVQALGASAGAVIGNAIARDLWSGKTLADRLSALVLVIGVAPILAPSLGGVILLYWDWHGMFWFLSGVWCARVAGSHDIARNIRSGVHVPVRLRDAARTYIDLLRNTPLVLYMLVGACGVGTLLGYITCSAFVYINVLGVSMQMFAVLFGVNAVGFVVAAQLNRVFLRYASLMQVATGAVFTTLACAVLVVVVALLGWANVAVLTVLFFVLAAAIGCIFPDITAVGVWGMCVRTWAVLQRCRVPHNRLWVACRGRW
jgi:DHA1 family bicyclomycin/chloramphenicol resistance-like MFS transporter